MKNQESSLEKIYNFLKEKALLNTVIQNFCTKEFEFNKEDIRYIFEKDRNPLRQILQENIDQKFRVECISSPLLEILKLKIVKNEEKFTLLFFKKNEVIYSLMKGFDEFFSMLGKDGLFFSSYNYPRSSIKMNSINELKFNLGDYHTNKKCDFELFFPVTENSNTLSFHELLVTDKLDSSDLCIQYLNKKDSNNTQIRITDDSLFIYHKKIEKPTKIVEYEIQKNNHEIQSLNFILNFEDKNQHSETFAFKCKDLKNLEKHFEETANLYEIKTDVNILKTQKIDIKNEISCVNSIAFETLNTYEKNKKEIDFFIHNLKQNYTSYKYIKYFLNNFSFNGDLEIFDGLKDQNYSIEDIFKTIEKKIDFNKINCLKSDKKKKNSYNNSI